MALIDEFVHEANFSESHDIVIAAPMEKVFATLTEVTPAEVPMFRLLMGLRSLPARFGGRGGIADDVPLLEQFNDISFKQLALDPPVELVMGGIGRFWRLDGGLHGFEDSASFKAFSEPGFVKTAMNFYLQADDPSSPDHATLLSTETRVEATDDGAHRRFFLYWTLISRGSSEIRKDWLRAIKRRAEARTVET